MYIFAELQNYDEDYHITLLQFFAR